VYEPNLEDFSDLDDEDVQEERLNTMSPHELETEVKKESDMSASMVEEVLGNSSVESPIEIRMVLEESHDISHPKLPDSSSHMLGVQHIISLEQHIELFDPLPHARDEEDEIILVYLIVSIPYLHRFQTMFVTFHTLNHLVFIVTNLRSL